MFVPNAERLFTRVAEEVLGVLVARVAARAVLHQDGLRLGAAAEDATEHPSGDDVAVPELRLLVTIPARAKHWLLPTDDPRVHEADDEGANAPHRSRDLC